MTGGDGISDEAGVNLHAHPVRPERTAVNLRRVAVVVDRRLNILRNALDNARDAFLELRSRVATLETWRTTVAAPALQALNQKNQQQDARLAALEARVTVVEGGP